MHGLAKMKPSATGEHDDMFEIDEIDEASRSPGKAASSSPEAPDGLSDEGPSSSNVANEDIELSRRAVPVVEVEEDVCSICLDEFTREDPEQQTVCE